MPIGFRDSAFRGLNSSKRVYLVEFEWTEESNGKGMALDSCEGLFRRGA